MERAIQIPGPATPRPRPVAATVFVAHRPPMDDDALLTAIRSAFRRVEPPPAYALARSREGEEPAALERAFAEVPSWESLTSGELDAAPEGWGTALSFFSDEAFRYYLPAYLIADAREELERADPLFHLTHGFTDDSWDRPVNPRRYGVRTWFDQSSFRFSTFDRAQSEAVVRYLGLIRSRGRTDLETGMVDQALARYWLARAEAT